MNRDNENKEYSNQPRKKKEPNRQQLAYTSFYDLNMKWSPLAYMFEYVVLSCGTVLGDCETFGR